MAFSYGFFDSKNLDRVYTAEDFTSYLSGMICDGVFDTYGDNFSVSAGDNVSVVIGTGKAWIDGHFFLNDIAYKLALKKYVDESLNRYVIIGISCDTSDSVRACQIEVKSGTAATSPSVPSFQNTDTKKYLTLAAVRLNNGITEISQSDITDYRSNEKKCGYVKCILGKCRVSEILSSLDTYNSTITQLNNHVTELQNRLAEVEAVTGATGVILVSAGQIGSNAFYALYSDGTLRINGSGSTYSYTGLNNSIFYMNSNIKKIIVSSGITALGDFLFESCDNIKTVSLASTVTSIGASAFSSTGLEEITIPASVKSIGEYAFKGTKLTDITIPESVTSMGYYIFSSCTRLKTVKINGSVISSYTFAFCYALSNLTISVNCKSIGSNIIAYCQYLDKINYDGTIAQWNSIQKPDNWISSADHNYNGYLKKIQCSNGYLEYNIVNYTWKEVKN